MVELVAYYTLRTGAADAGPRASCTSGCATGCRRTWCRPIWSSWTRSRCCPSDKADRKSLPARPRGAPADTAAQYVAADHRHRDGSWPTRWPRSWGWTGSRPTATSSTTSARTRCCWPLLRPVRGATTLPPLSMKDMYQHPTVRSLAADLGTAVPEPTRGRGTRRTGARRAPASTTCVRRVRGAAAGDCSSRTPYGRRLARRPGVRLADRRRGLVGGVPAARSCWPPWGSGSCRRCRSWRSGCCSGGGRRREIRVWSLAYLRFWVVQDPVRANPLVLFVGLPAVRRSTCGPWARRSAGGVTILSRARAGLHRPARPSATARSSARTRSSPATAPMTA